MQRNSISDTRWNQLLDSTVTFILVINAHQQK